MYKMRWVGDGIWMDGWMVGKYGAVKHLQEEEGALRLATYDVWSRARQERSRARQERREEGEPQYDYGVSELPLLCMYSVLMGRTGWKQGRQEPTTSNLTTFCSMLVVNRVKGTDGRCDQRPQQHDMDARTEYSTYATPTSSGPVIPDGPHLLCSERGDGTRRGSCSFHTPHSICKLQYSMYCTCST